MPRALGYLRFSIRNFSKVEGDFVAIKDKFTKDTINYEDHFEKNKI